MDFNLLKLVQFVNTSVKWGSPHRMQVPVLLIDNVDFPTAEEAMCPDRFQDEILFVIILNASTLFVAAKEERMCTKAYSLLTYSHLSYLSDI